MTTITRFDPFRTAGFHSEVDRLLREATGSGRTPVTAGAFAPALDVHEGKDGYTIHVELPGVASDDVELTLEDNVLTIAGERRFYDQRDADEFRRVERSFGRFHRSVRLPDRVAGDQVTARHADGVLAIWVPKAEDAKPRRISISD